MKGTARKALVTIQRCIAADRYGLTFHFQKRMDKRGLFWGDVLHAVHNAEEITDAGFDDYGVPKWIVRGPAAIGQVIEVVCTIETDESGVQFITLYWE